MATAQISPAFNPQYGGLPALGSPVAPTHAMQSPAHSAACSPITPAHSLQAYPQSPAHYTHGAIWPGAPQQYLDHSHPTAAGYIPHNSYQTSLLQANHNPAGHPIPNGPVNPGDQPLKSWYEAGSPPFDQAHYPSAPQVQSLGPSYRIPAETKYSPTLRPEQSRYIPAGYDPSYQALSQFYGFSSSAQSLANCVLEQSKPNLCTICGKSYARPSTLKTHMRTHSGEKPFQCKHCKKRFSQAANLTAHMRTHSGEKPFKCVICDRRFSQSSSVTTHMRTHSGERPYRCRYCKKSFADSSTLTKHLRIHSGEKPYQCKTCYLKFSQSGNLNRHMKVHSQKLS